jgi:hypothetical protein
MALKRPRLLDHHGCGEHKGSNSPKDPIYSTHITSISFLLSHDFYWVPAQHDINASCEEFDSSFDDSTNDAC